MVLDYSNFTLGIKNIDAQFTVEPWSSAMNAKGQLQQAWFRVSGIPVDQRGLRTNKNYVRVKIACRNVDMVPASAESTLELFIYDFFFERELSQDERVDHPKTKIPSETHDLQPSPKKPRTDHTGREPEVEAHEENKFQADS